MLGVKGAITALFPSCSWCGCDVLGVEGAITALCSPVDQRLLLASPCQRKGCVGEFTLDLKFRPLPQGKDSKLPSH